MPVTRAAQHTARAALLEPFRIKPFFDSLKAQPVVAVVLHGKLTEIENSLGINFITPN